MSEQPIRWYPFKDWCRSKGFTRQHGYTLIKRGELNTVKSGVCRYVTETEDRRFTEACQDRGEAA
jgi:hypothetical protein